MDVVSKTYNQGVSHVTLNRILIILGILGIYVAGVLTGMHFFEVDIPCTAGGGCATVARHPSSYLLGQPVALFGLLGYLFLTALAITRAFFVDKFFRPLTLAGYLASAFGMIFSLYLQYISLTQIGATCVWCMTSAIVMVATFVVYTMLFSKVTSVETPEVPVRHPKMLFLGLAGVLVASAAVGITLKGRPSLNVKTEILEDSVASHIAPAERNQIGPDNAPVTILEYADLCCPTCRKSFPKVEELVAKYPGKIRVIYRHHPIDQLPGHEMALVAAITSEIAASKKPSKFWDFAKAFIAPEVAPNTREAVDQIARTVGITPEEIQDAIDDPNSAAKKRMLRDYDESISIFHVDSTPTYIVSVSGRPIQKFSNMLGLMNEIDNPEIQKLLKP
jgi:uncharacterized membrane protein/protein-disulfide isomerase